MPKLNISANIRRRKIVLINVTEIITVLYTAETIDTLLLY